MPSRRQAALWLQCSGLLGSQPFLVEVQAPSSRQRSLSGHTSRGGSALALATGDSGGFGASSECRREQPLSTRACNTSRASAPLMALDDR